MNIFNIHFLIFRQEGDEISLNTETTFRTTETKFRLNQTWKEDTAGRFFKFRIILNN